MPLFDLPCGGAPITVANIAGCGESTCRTCCKSSISSPANMAAATTSPTSPWHASAAGIDPETQQIVALFNPRTESWHDHFLLQDVGIIGRTATGRATVRVLQMNSARRLSVRAALKKQGELDVD